MRWTFHVASTVDRRGIYRVLLAKPEVKRLLARRRCRWEDNIKMDLLEVDCGGIDYTDLAHDRESWPTLVNAAVSLQVP